jgi:hypothetical protein
MEFHLTILSGGDDEPREVIFDLETGSGYAIKRTVRVEVPGAMMQCDRYSRFA